MTLKKYLKEWDEPLNEGIIDKAKTFIKKYISKLKPVLIASCLGIMCLVSPMTAHSQEAQKVEQVINKECDKEDKALFYNWAGENDHKIKEYLEEWYNQDYWKLEEKAKDLTKLYSELWDANYKPDSSLGFNNFIFTEMSNKILIPTTEKQMSKIYLLKEGKEDEFLKWVVKCAAEANKKTLDYLSNEILELEKKVEQKYPDEKEELRQEIQKKLNK